ncbi:MAG: VOC family protein [Mastigocoleus sp.]
MSSYQLSAKDAFVAIASENIDILVDFYRQFFDQQPSKFIPKIYAEFHLQGLKIGIFKPSSAHLSEFQSSSKSKMSLCLEVDNLENAIAHVMDLGYPPSGEIITASHGREVYAFDPEGNRIILHQSHK